MKSCHQLITSWRRLPHHQAWTLAWPMILSNMSVPLMGLADTAMLGHLDDSVYLGAVAIGSNIIALFYWMFAFLRMGTTSVSAQAMGAQNPQLAMLHLTQNAGLALLLGVALIGLQTWLVPLALWLIAPEQTLSQLAWEYCQIRIYSAPAVLLTYVAMGWLLGLKKPKVPLVITILANLTNVVLDYLFIVEWQWGARGAATATLIAEYLACVMSALYIFFYLLKQGWRPGNWLDLIHLRSNLKLGLDLFIRTTALLFVINFFNAQSAQFGNDTLAANALLVQCVLFVAFFLDGYALAAETMTARAIGARQVPQFHFASAATASTAFFIALGLSLFFMVFGNMIIHLLTDIDAVAKVAREHIIWLILMPIISVGCYALDGIFIGAGQTRTMRNAMLLSVAVGFLPIWWVTQDLGNHGLWLAFALFNVYRGITLGVAYYRRSRRGTWLLRAGG